MQRGMETILLSRFACWPGLSCIHFGEGLPGKSIGGSSSVHMLCFVRRRMQGKHVLKPEIRKLRRPCLGELSLLTQK
jgi:hypothetical protein